MAKFIPSRVLLVVLLVCWLASNAVFPTSAFMFDLQVKEKRCFTEDVPSDADVTISFMAGEGYGQFVDVFLTLVPEGGANDASRLLIWKETSGSKGSFKQRITQGGELELCFVSRVASGMKVAAGESRSVFLEFIIGANPREFEKVATRNKLRPIQAQLMQLEDSVRDILGEYHYYKHRESEMRGTNEHMTARIMGAATVVILIIIVFSYIQIKQLERFLRKKRMID